MYTNLKALYFNAARVLDKCGLQAEKCDVKSEECPKSLSSEIMYLCVGLST